MKPNILSGAALAAAALSLAIAGAAPAEAKHKAHHRPSKETAEKHKCSGKNSCPAKAESKEAPADARPAEGKPGEGK
ncbi:hypothetical protein OGR47_03435 [Methylocystis sp. MJC1]|jgi:uncharacterized low-complexity protein|uniref:hypothetical protein n=1 Tax=Methylocystis sp. MJC1 TaxID=2654282 RepID=UPI0013EAC0A8|nr:hypothetical protein [Methylocystis sp. MJC1]KAF2991013.1 hypothetical protein MJC1_01745 [Methylocystis sp. MJC1]MBU6526067.1 hypothetical protein [Methylocystis sp. MJC1]UZX12529.1 hypothetical protein OGR47_03435 [Methylocystis sp. MJC1]